MGDTATSTAIATIVATLITAGVAIVTQRSASKAAVRNAEVTSRTDIEKEAFERAKGFYSGALDRAEIEIARQGKEIGELEGDVDRLKNQVATLESDLATARRELDIAKRALQLRYPDEP